MLNDLSQTGAETALATAWSDALATDTGYTLKCGCASCMKSAGFKAESGLLPPDGVGGDLKDVGEVRCRACKLPLTCGLAPSVPLPRPGPTTIWWFRWT